MPKAKRTRLSRQSGPYTVPLNVAPDSPRSQTQRPPPEMGDPYLAMHPQHSPANWGHQTYPQYPPAVMSSGPDYNHSLLTPGLHQSAMPAPVLPPHSHHTSHRGQSHSRQPSQSTPWTQAEDEMLRRARQKGLGWSAIQEQYFPGKSGNACRKRYERVMIKNRGADWDEQKLEVLASQYKKMRMHIWQPLAQSVGEKWKPWRKLYVPCDHVCITYLVGANLVVQCMSQGLKTLSNKASSHQRNQSSSGGSSGHRISSEFERDHSSPNDDLQDSGLHDSGIGLSVSGRRSTGRHKSASLGHIVHDYDGLYGAYQ